MKHANQSLPFLKKAIIAVGVIAAALWIFIFIAVLVSVYISPFWNTDYALGYTQKKFNTIKIDMNKEQVISLLGNPLKIYTDPYRHSEEIWYYSFDKKFKQGGSNHFVRNIIFKDEKVIRITREIYFD